MAHDLVNTGGELAIVTGEVPKIKNFEFFKPVDPINEYNVYRTITTEDDDPLVKGIPYIFITTPSLNLEEYNVHRSMFFSRMFYEELDVLSLLNFGTASTIPATSSSFIKLLTNRFKGFEVVDTNVRVTEFAETFYGYKQTLPGKIIDSINGGEFSITYSETKRMLVTNLHKAWLEYTEHVRRGNMRPSEEAIKNNYIDYLSSVYYFLLDFDGETILYYSRYVGIAPVSISYSAYGGEVGSHDLVDVNIGYLYNYKEDLNPNILVDFNKTALYGGSLFTETDENGEVKSYINTVDANEEKRLRKEFDITNNSGKKLVEIVKTEDSNGKTKFKLKFS